LARKPRKPRKVPKLLQGGQETSRAINNIGKALQQQALQSTANQLSKSLPEGYELKQRPKYLEVTEKRLIGMGVIDLKPLFAKSSKKKFSKKGGWYLDIPIRRKARGMTRRMYDQLRAVDMGGQQKINIISDYLYDNRGVSDAPLLNYKPKSNVITKIASGKGRHDYVAFRRVSNNSSPSSWIINRDRVTVANTSKTFVANVNRLMKYNMKNM